MTSNVSILFVEKIQYVQQNMYRVLLRCESKEDILTLSSRIEDAEKASGICFKGCDVQRHNMAVVPEGKREVAIVPSMCIIVAAEPERHPVEIASYFLDLIS